MRSPLLVLDTSAGEIAVALARPGERLATLRHRPSGHLAEQLGAAIERLVAGEGLPLREIGAIAVVRGPGSFTGLRVSLAFALGFSAAHGARTLGVTSLDAAAAAAAGRALAGSFAAALRSGERRADWYVRRYRLADGSFETDEEILALEGAELERHLAGHAVASDPARPGALPLRELVLEGAARLAQDALVGRRPAEPLEPLYVLEPGPVAKLLAAQAARR